MKRLDTGDAGFETAFTALLDDARETTQKVDGVVAGIIADIRARGDAPNTFEEAEQLRAVREIFLGLQRPFIRRVDASRPAQEVLAGCLAEFARVIQ